MFWTRVSDSGLSRSYKGLLVWCYSSRQAAYPLVKSETFEETAFRATARFSTRAYRVRVLKEGGTRRCLSSNRVGI